MLNYQRVSSLEVQKLLSIQHRFNLLVGSTCGPKNSGWWDNQQWTPPVFRCNWQDDGREPQQLKISHLSQKLPWHVPKKNTSGEWQQQSQLPLSCFLTCTDCCTVADDIRLNVTIQLWKHLQSQLPLPSLLSRTDQSTIALDSRPKQITMDFSWTKSLVDSNHLEHLWRTLENFNWPNPVRSWPHWLGFDAPSWDQRSAGPESTGWTFHMSWSRHWSWSHPGSEHLGKCGGFNPPEKKNVCV